VALIPQDRLERLSDAANELDDAIAHIGNAMRLIGADDGSRLGEARELLDAVQRDLGEAE
jgi:hypothetical protein